jgi:hypothetical protein
MMLWACCAGPAVAAMLVTGSGPASASALTPAGNAVAGFNPHGPGPGGGGNGPWGGRGRPNCDTRQLERWDVGGTNTVDLVWGTGNYTYGVHIRQDGSCIRGTLTDIGIPNGPTAGPIFGTINGNQVTFSFRYTYSGQVQGLRTFTGFIGRSGAVSGTWSETGPEHGHGTWELANRADRACSPHVLRWRPWRLCPVHS